MEIDADAVAGAGDGRDEIIDFGSFRLVPATRSLTRDGAPVHLGARALDLLIALLARPGEVIGRDELFTAAWPGIFVDESNLRVNISALRKALGDGKSGRRLIACIPSRGYSFVGEVRKRRQGTRSASPITPDDRHALPTPLQRLVGRDEIVAMIGTELPQRHFITVVGAGGIGKTSVALAVAEQLAPTYRDGVRVVDLAPLASAALVPAHLASLLQVQGSDRPPLEGVIAFLKTRQMLIIFDNCERVLDSTSAVAEEILRWAPDVHILATSREPMRAMGEWVQRLTPLDTPRRGEVRTMREACDYPAVQLLVERAMASQASLEFTDADAPIAAELCTHLDGLPLAIELAATRVPLFGLRGVADRLDDRFSFLTRGRRTAARRHQTLTAMIDWSYEILPAEEKALWRRLSVFSGAFSVDAANAVALDPDEPDLDIVYILANLVEKSVVVVDSRNEHDRYRMLESLRLYAQDKLAGTGEFDRVRRRHAEYFRELALAEYRFIGETPTNEWLARHRGEIADIRTALDWAFASPGDTELALELTAASAPIWFKLLLVSEFERYLKQAVVRRTDATNSDVAMRLHYALGHAIFHLRGYRPESIEALRAALALAEERDDVEVQMQALWSIYGVSSAYGDYDAVMFGVEGVRKLLPRAPSPLAGPLFHRMAGLAFHLIGDQRLALDHAEKALDHPAVRQRVRGQGLFSYDQKITASSHYARILWINGFADQAAALVGATIQDALTVDQPFPLSYFLVFGACLVAFWSGQVEAARGHIMLLRTVASSSAFNVWQMGGRIYEHVLEYLDASDVDRAAKRQALLTRSDLTPFQAESLGTIDWHLVCPSALAGAVRGETNWATAENLRAHGEALFDTRGIEAWPEAERFFSQALDISRRQHALAWELRAATSLARLWQAQGKASQAIDLLSAVHGRLTEGFDTRDLQRASSLLRSLG